MTCQGTRLVIDFQGSRETSYTITVLSKDREGRPDRWFVYMARCADGSLYTGIARNVAARIAQHDAGKGARYTRGRGPLTVCAVRRCETKGDALRLELAVKGLSRDRKLFLAEGRGRLAAFARKLGIGASPERAQVAQKRVGRKSEASRHANRRTA